MTRHGFKIMVNLYSYPIKPTQQFCIQIYVFVNIIINRIITQNFMIIDFFMANRLGILIVWLLADCGVLLCFSQKTSIALQMIFTFRSYKIMNSSKFTTDFFVYTRSCNPQDFVWGLECLYIIQGKLTLVCLAKHALTPVNRAGRWSPWRGGLLFFRTGAAAAIRLYTPNMPFICERTVAWSVPKYLVASFFFKSVCYSSTIGVL